MRVPTMPQRSPRYINLALAHTVAPLPVVPVYSPPHAPALEQASDESHALNSEMSGFSLKLSSPTAAPRSRRCLIQASPHPRPTGPSHASGLALHRDWNLVFKARKAEERAIGRGANTQGRCSLVGKGSRVAATDPLPSREQLVQTAAQQRQLPFTRPRTAPSPAGIYGRC